MFRNNGFLKSVLLNRENEMRSSRLSRRGQFLARKRIIEMDDDQLKSYEEIYSLLNSNRISDQCHGAQALRRASEKEAENGMISEEFLMAGLLTQPIGQLNTLPSLIQNELLGSLINISALENGAEYLIATRCLESLIQCAKSKSQSRSKALWCLTNMLCYNKIPSNEYGQKIVKKMIKVAMNLFDENDSVLWTLKCCGLYFQKIDNGEELFQIIIYSIKSKLQESFDCSIIANDVNSICDNLSIYELCPNFLTEQTIEMILRCFELEDNKIKEGVLQIIETMALYTNGNVYLLFERIIIDWLLVKISFNETPAITISLLLSLIKSTETHQTIFQQINGNHLDTLFTILFSPLIASENQNIIGLFVIKCCEYSRLLEIFISSPSFTPSIQQMATLSQTLLDSIVELLFWILHQPSLNNNLIHPLCVGQIAQTSTKYILTEHTKQQISFLQSTCL